MIAIASYLNILAYVSINTIYINAGIFLTLLLDSLYTAIH